MVATDVRPAGSSLVTRLTVDVKPPGTLAIGLDVALDAADSSRCILWRSHLRTEAPDGRRLCVAGGSNGARPTRSSAVIAPSRAPVGGERSAVSGGTPVNAAGRRVRAEARGVGLDAGVVVVVLPPTR